MRIGRRMKFINLFQVNAGSSSANSVSDSILFLSSINPKKLEIKVMFPNPELVSLSSQTEPDNMVIKFSKDLILNDKDGNSMVFDTGFNSPNSIDYSIPIQAQANEESKEQKNLETASSTV